MQISFVKRNCCLDQLRLGVRHFVVKQKQVVYYFLDRSVVYCAIVYCAIANFLSSLQLNGGLNTEDSAKNYKNLQNSLSHNACHPVGVKGIGAHLL